MAHFDGLGRLENRELNEKSRLIRIFAENNAHPLHLEEDLDRAPWPNYIGDALFYWERVRSD